MPKHYAVTPILRPGKTVYSATFKNVHVVRDEVAGVENTSRVTRSLATADADAAKVICGGLVLLANAKVTDLAKIPGGVSPESVRLYFALEETGDATRTAASNNAHAAAVLAEVGRFPLNVQKYVEPILIDRYQIRCKLEDAQIKFAALLNEHETLKADYEALKRSVVARVAESADNQPGLEECLKLFATYLATKTTADNTKIHTALARRFVATLPPSVKKLVEVHSDQIETFLDSEVVRTKTDSPLARRRNLHIRLARFINWGAERYGYPSQMTAIAFVKKAPLRRERGEIVWHELAEVQAAVAAQESPYWKALVATLGYAGPQLAELCWLRLSDVTIDGNRGRLWIGPVTDPVTGEFHPLKTGDRERHVDIHPRLLLPLLKEHIAALPKDAVYLFPMPETARNRKRKGKGKDTRRWLESVLSTVLRGHKGGKDQKKRPPTAGKLPKGMNAATLRHTFGSLLLRSGKTHAQCAAAMGHTEQTNMDFYAKLKGHEVDVNF